MSGNLNDNVKDVLLSIKAKQQKSEEIQLQPIINEPQLHKFSLKILEPQILKEEKSLRKTKEKKE